MVDRSYGPTSPWDLSSSSDFATYWSGVSEPSFPSINAITDPMQDQEK